MAKNAAKKEFLHEMGLHKCNLDFTEIFEKSVQEQIKIKRKNILAIGKSVRSKIVCVLNREKTLTFFSTSRLLPFCANAIGEQ